MSVIANPTLTGNELDLERLQVGNGHYKAPFARKNLLNNWYFVGGGDQQGGGGQFPVNQRKQTSYIGTVYGIDTWHSGNANLKIMIGANDITLQNGASSVRAPFSQKFDNQASLYGKTVTGSILLTDGTLHSGTATLLAAPPASIAYATFANFNGHTIRIEEATTTGATKIWSFQVMVAANTSLSVVAVKLELGDTQTLAHLENGVWVLNEIPDYTTQLLRCQRFFRVFTSTSASTTGYGYSTNPKNLRPEMRATPSTGSFTYSGTTYYYLDANL